MYKVKERREIETFFFFYSYDVDFPPLLLVPDETSCFVFTKPPTFFFYITFSTKFMLHTKPHEKKWYSSVNSVVCSECCLL